jgi:hypothetical protein
MRDLPRLLGCQLDRITFSSYGLDGNAATWIDPDGYIINVSPFVAVHMSPASSEWEVFVARLRITDWIALGVVAMRVWNRREALVPGLAVAHSAICESGNMSAQGSSGARSCSSTFCDLRIRKYVSARPGTHPSFCDLRIRKYGRARPATDPSGHGVISVPNALSRLAGG